VEDGGLISFLELMYSLMASLAVLIKNLPSSKVKGRLTPPEEYQEAHY
jgi:hypothetical protein